MRNLIIAALAAATLPGLAHAAAFTNGSFENTTFTPGNPDVDSRGFRLLTASSPYADDIDGWLVTTGSIDFIDGYWNAAAGTRSVDLSGVAAGTLAQTFDTVVGQAYRVGFSIAANGDGPPLAKMLSVLASGNAAATYGINYTGVALPAMNWTPFSYDFVATGTSTTLSFASATTTPYGPALDAVSVTAVPEPATWAMMIGGLAATGGALRRRRTSPAAFA